MDKEIIKEALSYSLGSDLHEIWRKNRLKDDGTYEPRIKKTKDINWIEKNKTNMVDIANCTFSSLPEDWQYENLEAAKVVISLVYDKVMNNEEIDNDSLEEMASIIHDKWLERNMWVFDINYGNPKLSVSYDKLEKEEQDKDKDQIYPGIKKVEDYKNKLINIKVLCEEYKIENNVKTLNLKK